MIYSKTKRKPWMIIFLVLLTLTIFSTSLSLSPLIDMLNIETQSALSLSSTLTQVCVTLYGIAIAVYVFLEDKLKGCKEISKNINDNNIFNAIKNLLRDHKAILIYISILTGIIIALGGCSIVVARPVYKITPIFSEAGNIFLSSMCVFSIITTISVLYFVFSVIKLKIDTSQNNNHAKSKKTVIILVKKNTKHINR